MYGKPAILNKFYSAIKNGQIVFIVFVLLAISLPVSKFLMTFSQCLIAILLLFEGNFKEKLTRLRAEKSFWIFSGYFLAHIVWLINTTNYSYAWHDIVLKIPLFVIPFLFVVSKPITIKQLRIILLCFIGSVLVATFLSTGALFKSQFVSVFYHWIKGEELIIRDIRNISLFFSHIRFSVMVNMAIYSALYLIINHDFSMKTYEKVFYGICIAWFIVFLFFLKSLTGLVILFITSSLIGIYVLFTIKHLVVRLFLIALGISVLLISASYVSKTITKFYTIEKVDLAKLEHKTLNGNTYFHNITNKQIENGNYISLYISRKELEQEWNKRSELAYSGKDKLDQDLKYTLIRYLTSKGLRKDSVGISKLEEKDIHAIENGYANYIYLDKKSLYPRLYQLIWEFDVYNKGANPSGHSVTQRFKFLKAAFGIISENFFFGVGTGDVKDAYRDYYERINSPLSYECRGSAHNQFVTSWVTFGLVGFIYILFALSYPIITRKSSYKFLLASFIIITFLVFLDIDTLETQAGVTFFSYFYGLLIFGTNKVTT